MLSCVSRFSLCTVMIALVFGCKRTPSPSPPPPTSVQVRQRLFDLVVTHTSNNELQSDLDSLLLQLRTTHCEVISHKPLDASRVALHVQCASSPEALFHSSNRTRGFWVAPLADTQPLASENTSALGNGVIACNQDVGSLSSRQTFNLLCSNAPAPLYQLARQIHAPANTTHSVRCSHTPSPEKCVLWRLQINPVLQSSDIAESREIPATASSEQTIAITLTESARERFAAFTTQFVDQTIAMSVDNTILMMPVIASPISGGRLTITLDSNTSKDAPDLAERILESTRHTQPIPNFSLDSITDVSPQSPAATH